MIRKYKIVTVLIFFTVIHNSVCAQSSVENAGWVFIKHNQNLSKKWEALADVQMRTGDKFIHFQTLLLRFAISYKINKEQSGAFGYAYKGDWTEVDREQTYGRENRIHEQYSFETKIKQIRAAFRLRQEQRFVKETKDYQFSQRSRGFLSLRIPLAANADFSKGLYTTIQNEIFLNTQHKEKVNNSFFDQNRPFISVGYRWSKKIDSEIGYMRWLKREPNRNISSNIIQLVIASEL